MRKPRPVTPEEHEYLMSLTVDDYGVKLLASLFATTNKKPAKFIPKDTMTLPAGKINNKTTVKTTVGRYIHNMGLLYKVFGNTIEYTHYAWDNKGYGKLEGDLETLLMEDKITGRQIAQFINEWRGCTSAAEIMNPSANVDVMATSPEVDAYKKKLFKQYDDELNNGNIEVMNKVDKLITAKVIEVYSKNPAFSLYETGGKPKASEQLKQGIACIGYVRVDGKDIYIRECFADGVSIEGNILEGKKATDGVVDRNKSTQDGGYQTKLVIGALTTYTVDRNPKSDCKSTTYYKVKLTKDNKKDWLYTFVRTSKSNHNLVELTSENIDNFLDKDIEVRAPLFCKSKTICSKCIGTRPYRMEIYDIGLIYPSNTSGLLQKALKAMHSTKVDLVKLDFYGAFKL
jgi:hypothetical protein